MKKERVVAICICAILLGTMYAQWLAWIFHVASPAQTMGRGPRSFAAGFLAAGWPPVACFYDEARVNRPASVHRNESRENSSALRASRGGK